MERDPAHLPPFAFSSATPQELALPQTRSEAAALSSEDRPPQTRLSVCPRELLWHHARLTIASRGVPLHHEPHFVQEAIAARLESKAPLGPGQNKSVPRAGHPNV